MSPYSRVPLPSPHAAKKPLTPVPCSAHAPMGTDPRDPRPAERAELRGAPQTQSTAHTPSPNTAPATLSREKDTREPSGNCTGEKEKKERKKRNNNYSHFKQTASPSSTTLLPPKFPPGLPVLAFSFPPEKQVTPSKPYCCCCCPPPPHPDLLLKA